MAVTTDDGAAVGDAIIAASATDAELAELVTRHRRILYEYDPEPARLPAARARRTRIDRLYRASTADAADTGGDAATGYADAGAPGGDGASGHAGDAHAPDTATHSPGDGAASERPSGTAPRPAPGDTPDAVPGDAPGAMVGDARGTARPAGAVGAERSTR